MTRDLIYSKPSKSVIGEETYQYFLMQYLPVYYFVLYVLYQKPFLRF